MLKGRTPMMLRGSCTAFRNVARGALVLLVGISWPASTMRAQSAAAAAPKYEVDPAWPKPFPDRWVIGGLGGLCVDANDHVLILNRQDVMEGELNAGALAPAMIEYDAAGNKVH